MARVEPASSMNPIFSFEGGAVPNELPAGCRASDSTAGLVPHPLHPLHRGGIRRDLNLSDEFRLRSLP
jgi:hypothetical protein